MYEGEGEGEGEGDMPVSSCDSDIALAERNVLAAELQAAADEEAFMRKVC